MPRFLLLQATLPNTVLFYHNKKKKAITIIERLHLFVSLYTLLKDNKDENWHIFLQFRDIEKMNGASYNIKGVQNENFKISVIKGVGLPIISREVPHLRQNSLRKGRL